MELYKSVTAVRYVEIWGYLVEKWWCWNFWALLRSNFWKLILRDSWLEIFWENALLLTWILHAKEIFLFPRICRLLKLPVLPDFAILKFGSSKLPYLIIFCNGRIKYICLIRNDLFYLISCSASWDFLVWVLSWHFEIVLISKHNAYHVCVPSDVGASRQLFPVLWGYKGGLIAPLRSRLWMPWGAALPWGWLPRERSREGRTIALPTVWCPDTGSPPSPWLLREGSQHWLHPPGEIGILLETLVVRSLKLRAGRTGRRPAVNLGA